MHTETKRTILVKNSTLLQASTKLADWRSVMAYLLGLKSSVGRLPPCPCANTTSAGTCVPHSKLVGLRTG